jgi:hypothetical protein
MWLFDVTHPRFAQAPADADAGGGGNPELEAGGGEEGGAPEAGGEAAKGAGEKAGEKGGQDKGGEEKKGEEKKPEGKTLLRRGKDAPAGDDKAGAKDQEGKEGKAGADELAAWNPALPEGQKADEELLGGVREWGKTHGLKGEQLQGVVDLGVKMQAKLAEGFQAAHDKMVSGFEDAARADKDIGGSKLDGVVQAGLATLKRFAGNEFDAVVSELERTGMGSHPALLKTLNRIHEATKEDDTASRVRGAQGASGGKSFAERMYGKSIEQGMSHGSKQE